MSSPRTWWATLTGTKLMFGFLFAAFIALAVLWWESMFGRLDLEKKDMILRFCVVYCTVPYHAHFILCYVKTLFCI